MAYSTSATSTYMRDTLFMYWRLSKEARALDCRGEDNEDLTDIKDEADVLADMCEWPRLRAVIKGNAALAASMPVARQSPA